MNEVNRQSIYTPPASDIHHSRLETEYLIGIRGWLVVILLELILIILFNGYNSIANVYYASRHLWNLKLFQGQWYAKEIMFLCYLFVIAPGSLIMAIVSFFKLLRKKVSFVSWYRVLCYFALFKAVMMAVYFLMLNYDRYGTFRFIQSTRYFYFSLLQWLMWVFIPLALSVVELVYLSVSRRVRLTFLRASG